MAKYFDNGASSCVACQYTCETCLDASTCQTCDSSTRTLVNITGTAPN